jgi:nicotinamidase-related amidase
VRGALGVLPRILELLDAFRAHHLPITYVIREHLPDGSDVEITRRERFLRVGGAFVPGTRGYALLDGLSPRAGEPIVRKKRWSAFHKTGLEGLLTAQGVDLVVLSGVQVPNCIRATALDANSLDFEVVISSDACGSSDPVVQETNLVDMANMGIQVMATKDIVAALPDRLGRGLVAAWAASPTVAHGRRTVAGDRTA